MNWRREAETIMNVGIGAWEDESIDDIIEAMIDACNYGVEGEEEIEAFLEKTNYGRNLK
jgi:hypothetical protein